MAIFSMEEEKNRNLFFTNLSGIAPQVCCMSTQGYRDPVHPCRSLQSDQTRLVQAECISTSCGVLYFNESAIILTYICSLILSIISIIYVYQV